MKIEKPPLAHLPEWARKLDRKLLIQGGIVLFAFLIFFIFFFLPVASKRKKMTVENAKLSRQIQTGTSKIAQIPQLKKEKELYGARIEVIRKSFFDVTQSGKLPEIFTTLANGNSVRIMSSRTISKQLDIPKESEALYQALHYDLTVQGPYHKLGSFINALEEYERNFAVYSLRMTKNSESPLSVDGQMELTIFLRAQPLDDLALPTAP